jgi:hypothetical protein
MGCVARYLTKPSGAFPECCFLEAKSGEESSKSRHKRYYCRSQRLCIQARNGYRTHPCFEDAIFSVGKENL